MFLPIKTIASSPSIAIRVLFRFIFSITTSPLSTIAHNLFKAEKIFFLRIMFTIILSQIIRLPMMWIVKFYRYKPATIDVKMNIAFLKIRRTGFPNFYRRIFHLDKLPYLLTDFPSLTVMLHIKKCKFSLLFMYYRYCAANQHTIHHGLPGSCSFCVQGLVDIPFRQNLPLQLAAGIFRTELKRFLHILFELPLIFCQQWHHLKLHVIYSSILHIKKRPVSTYSKIRKNRAHSAPYLTGGLQA